MCGRKGEGLVKKGPSQAGFSLVSSLVGLALVGSLMGYFAAAYGSYFRSKADVISESLVGEVRNGIVPRLAHVSRLFFAKNCVSNQWSGSLSDARYSTIYNAAISEFGSNFFAKSFNDLVIAESFGGLTTLGRPAQFSDPNDIHPDQDFQAALQRCDQSQLNISPTGTTFKGCYYYAATAAAGLRLPGYSILKGDGVLVEFRLEFVDLESYAPIRCNLVAKTKKAGVVAKTRVYWDAEDSKVRKVSDVFTFSR